MPTYWYKADDAEQACERCAEGFDVLQQLSDAPVAACLGCGRPVHRIVRAPEFCTNQRWNTKKMLADGNLKRMGFQKLVKNSSGKYEDVLKDK